MSQRIAYHVAFDPTTPVRVVAANPYREAFVFRVYGGVAHFGNDATVTAQTGFPWGEEDGPFVDGIGAVDELWVIGGRVGGTVHAWETTSAPPPPPDVLGT